MHKFDFVVVIRIFWPNERIYEDFECTARSLSSAIKKMKKHYRYVEILDYSVSEVY